MLFVFMSQPDFACNPYALWKYIKDNTNHDTAWLLKRDNHYEIIKARGIRCAIYNTLDGQRLLSEADYVITNSYTFLNLPKRDNQIFVNLWHGSGVKAHDFYNHDLNPKQVKKLNDFFSKIDLMCVHSLDDRFRLSAQLNFDLRKSYVTGQPRLDCVTGANGKEALVKIFGNKITKFEYFIFYAPSFRANMSSHSGKIFSDNIFRLDDYNNGELSDFLEKYNAALIYKLHPVEQTAFSGRRFSMNDRCFELTDDMLFDADIRYDEMLNAFDVMMSDYSSIVFDFLVLNRPIIYLIPDYEEYTSERGFVFHNVNYYMPGAKVYDFTGMLEALQEALESPDKYKHERDNVIMQRFDYLDGNAAERCYELMMHYKPPVDEYTIYRSSPRTKMPSNAEHIKQFCGNDSIYILDSTRDVSYDAVQMSIPSNVKRIIYITQEIPSQYRRLTGQSSADIANLQLYYDIQKLSNVEIKVVNGGVDYSKFAKYKGIKSNGRPIVGFAGTIDSRIYFAMVQCLCEVFSDCDIVFAGDIFGDYPVWLDGFKNLHYIEAGYDELPQIIQTFNVALLPFFGRHQQIVPTELFQYLACGKTVVASDMPNLPENPAIYVSKSVSDAVENVKAALKHCTDADIVKGAQRLAKEYDWEAVAQKIINCPGRTEL